MLKSFYLDEVFKEIVGGHPAKHTFILAGQDLRPSKIKRVGLQCGTDSLQNRIRGLGISQAVGRKKSVICISWVTILLRFLWFSIITDWRDETPDLQPEHPAGASKVYQVVHQYNLICHYLVCAGGWCMPVIFPVEKNRIAHPGISDTLLTCCRFLTPFFVLPLGNNSVHPWPYGSLFQPWILKLRFFFILANVWDAYHVLIYVTESLGHPG